jgi:hypothetical protein
MGMVFPEMSILFCKVENWVLIITQISGFTLCI